MSAQPTSNESPCEHAEGTLGALLYADATKPRISESEWVAIVRAIGKGEQLALRALYERTHRLVFTLIMRITNHRETAEELMLDVFHDVWRRASSYDASGGSVVGWIMNQARSRAIDQVRYEQRKKRTNPYPDQPLTESVVGGSDEVLRQGEQKRRLQEALAVLTHDERQVIETAFFSELTYAEAAQRLDQPLGTVKTRIRSGLEKLRRALETRAEES